MTQFIDISDASKNLTEYIEQVMQNHSEIIICKDGEPVCKLIGYKQAQPIKFGLLKGQIEMSDDFDDELPDEFWGLK